MAIEVYELVANFFSGGEPCSCVFNYWIDNTGNVHPYTVASQLRQAIDDGVPPATWLSRLVNCLSNEAYLSYVSARMVNPAGGQASVQRFPPTVFPGGVLEPIHTQQVCGTLIWVSTTEPENTGRNFLPGVPETFLTGSRWQSDAYDAYELFAAQHIAGFSVAAGLFLPVIYNRTAKTFRPISNGYLSPMPGTQRKREKPL